MTHEQKMQKEYPDYPCVNCSVANKDACDWRKCAKYDCWFTKRWGRFREAGELIKQQNERYSQERKEVKLRDVAKIVESVPKQE